MMRRARWRLRLLLGLATVALPVAAQTQEPIAGGELPPPGYGSLKQDNVSLRITLNDIEIRFLPLDERLIRLMAPDAYQSLHGLVVSRQPAIDSAARAAGLTSPGLALVTFFALRSAARFDPENVSLSYRSQFERPAAIVPYSGTFTSRQLDVRQQATGIYLFDEPLPVFEPFDVLYGTSQASWNDDVLRRIGVERVRVQSRAQASKGDSAAVKP
jgi:hypothetical protein